MSLINIPPELEIPTPEDLPFRDLVRELDARGYQLVNNGNGGLTVEPKAPTLDDVMRDTTDFFEFAAGNARAEFQPPLADDLPCGTCGQKRGLCDCGVFDDLPF